MASWKAQLCQIAFAVFLLVFEARTASSKYKLIVFLMDGFRWNYNIDDLKGFQMMIEQGTKAEYLQPDFPSLSYTNYYTIMTGLHSDKHRMVHNMMYDEQHQEDFNPFTNESNASFKDPFWWEDGEPIWITAKKQGLRTYMYDWSGCEVPIHGERPTDCRVYHMIPELNDTLSAVNLTLDLLQKDKDSAHFIGIYSEYPDHTGHMYGTESEERIEKVKGLDEILLFLLERLQTTPGPDGEMLSETVNVIVVSDHGMTDVSEDRVVNLTQYLDMSKVEHTSGDQGVWGIWPKEGELEEVYKSLQDKDPHYKVYRIQDLPERWHYAAPGRTPPITVVADLGWILLTPTSPDLPVMKATGLPMVGAHGYDNAHEEMRGIFLGIGPNFRKGYTQPGFPNVDIYNVMCAILGIKPNDNDGNWDEVSGMLKHLPSVTSISLVSWENVYITGVVAFFGMALFCSLTFLLYNRYTAARVKKYQPIHDMDHHLDLT